MVDNRAKKQYLIDTYYSFMISRCLFVANELGIADILHGKSLTIDEIASQVDCYPQYLDSVLRLLVRSKIFTKNADKYSNNEYSDLLRADHPDSPAALIAVENQCRWNAYGEMLYAVKSGNSSFEKLYGKGYFDYLEDHIDDNRRHARAAITLTAEEEQAIINAYDFAQYPTIVDVGGNTGSMLKQILLKYPQCQGILFDLPKTATSQQLALDEVDKQRWQAIGGNFFQADQIPQNGDLYLLKRVIHDWPDKEAIKILTNIRSRIAKNGKVLIADAVIDRQRLHSFMNFIEITLVCLCGGGAKERKENEFRAIAQASGFQLNQVIDTNSAVSIVELVIK